MKKLTKKERHDIYVEMLDYLQNDYMSLKFSQNCCGFCYCLSETLIFSNRLLEIKDFPELIKHEPKNHATHWFPRDESGYFKRQFILMTAIKETE